MKALEKTLELTNAELVPMGTPGAHAIVEVQPISPLLIQRQIQAIQQAMKLCMKEGTHYGLIPGCGDKKTLFKPGAEKICLMFRLSPKPKNIVMRELPNGHREYESLIELFDTQGNAVGFGVGLCTTMESKYRYRKGAPVNTGKEVPREYWEAKKKDAKAAQGIIGGAGFQTKKIDNTWFIFKSTDEKVENPDPADLYNTVYKMSKKRAFIDATLTATAASDIFDQDLVEEEAYDVTDESKKIPQKETATEDSGHEYIYDLRETSEKNRENAKKVMPTHNCFEGPEGVWTCKRRVAAVDKYLYQPDQQQE